MACAGHDGFFALIVPDGTPFMLLKLLFLGLLPETWPRHPPCLAGEACRKCCALWPPSRDAAGPFASGGADRAPSVSIFQQNPCGSGRAGKWRVDNAALGGDGSFSKRSCRGLVRYQSSDGAGHQARASPECETQVSAGALPRPCGCAKTGPHAVREAHTREEKHL